MATGGGQIEQGGQGSGGEIATRTDLVGSSHSKVVRRATKGEFCAGRIYRKRRQKNQLCRVYGALAWG